MGAEVVIVDGQEIEWQRNSPVMAFVHNQDMIIETPGYVDIDPESTVKTANEIEQNQWEQIRQHDRFLNVWETLWNNRTPPEVAAKASLAAKHSIGLILLIFKAQGEGAKMHLRYPETYLHPAQQQLLMSTINMILHGNPRGDIN